MPDHNLPLRAPDVSASAALLTAALSGLLTLSGCGSDPRPTILGTDAGADVVHPQDAPAADRPVTPTADVVDATAPADVVAGPDVVTAPDVAAATDVAAPQDVPAADAGAPADAVDAAAARDVVAAQDVPGAPDVSSSMDAVVTDASTSDPDAADAPFVCDVQADRVVTVLDSGGPISLEDFRAMCDRVGGFVEIHSHCGGDNSCAGFSWYATESRFTEHTCQGLSTCTGYTCVRR